MTNRNKTVKLYPPLVHAVSNVIDAIIENGYVIERTLPAVIQNKRFGSRDRKFIISSVYDIIRNYILYNAILLKKNDEDLDWHQQMVLLNLTYQKFEILNPDVIIPKGNDWIKQWQKVIQENNFSDATCLSYSDWFWEAGLADYSSNWFSIAKSLNSTAPIYLRANLLKTNATQLANALQKEGIEASEIPNSNALLLPNRDNLRNNNLFKKGHFEIQDLASQSVGKMAALKNGLLVIDVCAGAGGKSLQLASLLNNTGKIVASDVSPNRLKQLKMRAHKAGAKNIEVLAIENLHIYNGKADRVILDVPCSGSGTIRRQPEIKIHLTPEKVNEYLETQEVILEQYHQLLKPGGKLIYATCSIFKAESESQIINFLEHHSNFNLITEKRFVPPTHNSDGFYIAVLERIE